MDYTIAIYLGLILLTFNNIGYPILKIQHSKNWICGSVYIGLHIHRHSIRLSDQHQTGYITSII